MSVSFGCDYEGMGPLIPEGAKGWIEKIDDRPNIINI